MKILKNNWKWKLTSLIIGIFMWSYITAGVNPTQSMTISGIPLVIQNQDALNRNEFAITDIDVRFVSVKVTGKRNDLGRIKKNDITAAIDAEELKEGVQTAAISYTSPQNVVINETSDSTSRITVEKIITESRPVTVKQSGELQPQYILNAITVTPENLDLTGPRSLLDRVKEVIAMVDVSNLEGDISANKNVVAVDEAGNELEGVSLSLASVNISCSISKQKEVPIELELSGQEADNIKIKDIKPVPNTVLVKGKPEIIDALDKVKTKTIERSKLIREGTYPISINYPEGVQPVKEDINFKADLALEKEEEKKINIKSPNFEIDNLSRGSKGTVIDPPAEVVITIKGFPSDLEDIAEDKISLYLNADNGGEGDLQLPILMRPIEGLSLIKIEPAQLMLNILSN